MVLEKQFLNVWRREIEDTMQNVAIVVGLLILYLFRRPIGALYTRVIASLGPVIWGRVPKNVVFTVDGIPEGKCWKCSERVVYRKIDDHKYETECGRCGEKIVLTLPK